LAADASVRVEIYSEKRNTAATEYSGNIADRDGDH